MEGQTPDWVPDRIKPLWPVLERLHLAAEVHEVAVWLCAVIGLISTATFYFFQSKHNRIRKERLEEEVRRKEEEIVDAKVRFDELEAEYLKLKESLPDTVLAKASREWKDRNYHKANLELMTWLENEGRAVSGILYHRAKFDLSMATGENNIPRCVVANSLAKAAVAVCPEYSVASELEQEISTLQELEGHPPIPFLDAYQLLKEGEESAPLSSQDVELALQMKREAVEHIRAGLYALALAKMDPAILILREQRGNDALQTLNARRWRAFALYSKGESEEGLEEIKSVVRECIANPSIGAGHEEGMHSRFILATILNDLARYEAAYPLARQLADDWARKDATHPNYRMCLALMAQVLDNQERYVEALEVIKKVTAEDVKTDPDSWPALQHYYILAKILFHLERFEESYGIIRRVAERESKIDAWHRDTLLSRFLLAQVLDKLGMHDRAVGIMRDVVEKERIVLGVTHHETLTAFTILENALHEPVS